MKEPSPMPETVIDAIFKWAGVHSSTMRCPDCGQEHECVVGVQRTNLAHAVLREIRWDSLNGCYGFTRYGMYHGVEIDGYVHT